MTNDSCRPEIYDPGHYLSSNDISELSTLIMNNKECESWERILKLTVNNITSATVMTGQPMGSGHVFHVVKNNNKWNIIDVEYWVE